MPTYLFGLFFSFIQPYSFAVYLFHSSSCPHATLKLLNRLSFLQPLVHAPLQSLLTLITTLASSQSVFSQSRLLAPSQSPFLLYNPSIFSIYLLTTPAPCSFTFFLLTAQLKHLFNLSSRKHQLLAPSQSSFLLFNSSIFSIYLLAIL